MNIYIVRHTSVDVKPGTCYGQTDVALRSSFTDEAEKVKENLGKIMSSGVDFYKIYTSPLSRCVKLADYCGFPEAVRENRVKEINFGSWEMQPFDSIVDPQLQNWFEDFINVRPTNGESFMDLYHRVSSFLDGLKSEVPEDENVLIFAHGGILVCTQIYTGMIQMKQAFESVPEYGSILKFEIG